MQTGTNFQSLPFDPKGHTFVPPQFKQAEKPQFLRSVIERGKNPLGDAVLNLTVHGIYSLPEAWKAKIVKNNGHLQ